MLTFYADKALLCRTNTSDLMSSPGVFVGMEGKSNASKYKGILLFASYLTRDMPLATYPLPVLTISGDLDGQTRITRIADEFE